MLDEDQSDAINMLAAHYLDGAEMDRGAMVTAWREVLDISTDTARYSLAQIEASYEPMVQQGDYADDPEDCRGCHTFEDGCLKHRSFDQGMGSMGRAVATMVNEPEIMGEVLRQADKLDAQATHDPTSPEHVVIRCAACRDVPAGTRIQVNVECPDCQHSRQWFEPAKRQFSCQRCDRRSPHPHGQREEQPTENTGMDTTLWCVHSPADSYIPVPSYRGAEMYAREITEIVHQDWPDLPPARVIPWPESAEEWRRLIDSAPWPARYCGAAEK